MAHATYDGATGGTKKKAVWYQVELLTEGDGLRFMVVQCCTSKDQLASCIIIRCLGTRIIGAAV